VRYVEVTKRRRICEAEGSDIVAEQRQLFRDLIEARIAVKHDILAHVAALAEVGDSHVRR
jgi:hypothetical protein